MSTGGAHIDCCECFVASRSVWAGLDRPCFEMLAKGLSRRDYGSGQVVFLQGDPNAGIYCVRAGMIAIRRTDANGNSALLKLAYPGDTLGYRSFFEGNEHRSSAEAIGPAVVCRISRRTLLAAIAESPALNRCFVSRAVSDAESAYNTLTRQVALSNRGRLCQVLIDLTARHGYRDDDGADLLHLPITRRDLAAMIGTRHETVSRIMARLEKEGLAAFSGRMVRIPRLDALVASMDAELNG